MSVTYHPPGSFGIISKKWEYNNEVCQIFIDFEKTYERILVRYPNKIWCITKLRLIKTCLDGTESKVEIGNYLSSSFSIEKGLKQGDALSPLLFNFT